MQSEHTHTQTVLEGGNVIRHEFRSPEQVRQAAGEAEMLNELCREANGSLSARQLRRRLRGKRTNVTWER
jgi:hypothetical protein